MLPIFRRVIRLLISIVCVLGLAFTPVAANAAAAPSSDMPGCTMDGKMPSKAADHAKMDCCTPACHAPSASALLPNQDGAVAEALAPAQVVAWAPAKQLESILASGLDPPPRS